MGIFTQFILWIRKNPALFGATGFCIVYAFLAYVVPPHYTWFEWHRNIIALGVLVLGIVTFPLEIFLIFAGTIGVSSTIVALLYFPLAGIITGKTLQDLWQKGRAGKFLLGLAFILNLCVGLFILAWRDVLVTENLSLGCQKFVNSEQGLRIVTFEQNRILPDAYNFYLFTTDGGNSWAQLFSESNEIRKADCQTIQNLSSDFLWVWSSAHLRTTHDGGHTWEEWDWECCTYGAVEDVDFQDENNGTITVTPWRGSISELITQDGGKTWLPVK